MPLGLLSILLILLGLMFASNIAESQYNEALEANKENHEYDSFPGIRKQKIIYYFVTTLTTILVMSITLSGSKVENYLNWKKFIFDVIVAGSTAGVVFCWIYTKKGRIKFDNIKWDDHIRIAMFLIPFLVIFHSSVWYNYLKPSPVIRTTKAVVTDEGRKYIHLKFEGEEQRFSFGYPFNESVKKGDSVLLTLITGALKYMYADNPLKINK